MEVWGAAAGGKGEAQDQTLECLILEFGAQTPVNRGALHYPDRKLSTKLWGNSFLYPEASNVPLICFKGLPESFLRVGCYTEKWMWIRNTMQYS